MKIIVTVGVTLVIVGALVGAGLMFRGQTVVSANAVAVRVEPAKRGDLVEVVQSPGEVQPLNKVSISAKTSARIIELPFKEGDKVTEGAELVKMDSSDLEADLRSTQARYAAQQSSLDVAVSRVAAQRAQLEGLRATLAEAEKDLERQKGLIATHDVSQSVVDTSEQHLQETRASVESGIHSLKAEETNLLVLKHNLEAADADIARAKEVLSYTTITSPINGIVTTINAKVGELVVTGTMNNAGTVILEVADLSEMLVVARVDETDVANVEVGQLVRVRMQAYPGRVFTGKVTSVALARTTDRNASSVNDAKTFKVEILLDARGERIYSGLTADVEIETRTHHNVIKVPSQAVLGAATDDLPKAIRDASPDVVKSRTQTTVVYRFIDGKAVVTPVTVGASDISDTIIKSGLSETDHVITGPYKILEKLTNDQAVKEEAATTQPSPATQPTTREGRG